MGGNMPPGNMVPCSSYTGLLDLRGHGHLQQQQHLLLQQSEISHPNVVRGIFNHSMENSNNCNQARPVLAADCINFEKGKPLVITDIYDITEGGLEELREWPNDSKLALWKRMKWTDSRVRLLITIISYLGQERMCEDGNGNQMKFPVMHKKGKWKLVSEVMAQRGCCVSPQQCEDKYNDLNKRYKRLVDVLGRGTSCDVVENPSLLDHMNHLSEKAKDEVRKILSSKHLFYEEMCSYHNGNRLHLPPDPDLQKLVVMALKSKYEHGSGRSQEDEMDEDELEQRQCYNSLNSPKCGEKQFSQIGVDEMSCPVPTGIKADSEQDLLMKSRAVELEELKLQIEAQRLELEEQKIRWMRVSRKKDKELEVLRLENAKIRLGNEKMASELKQLEVEFKTNR